MPRPSPFPGMDPYLEQHWGDVQARLVTYACDQLQEGLPPGLRARMAERTFPESDTVVERQAPWDGPIDGPLIIVDDGPELVTQRFIEISEVGWSSRVVTVVEVLSPANRQPGEGRDLYRKQQRQRIADGVNLAEIDLLRSGQHVLAVPLARLRPHHVTPHMVCVRRGRTPGRAEVYPIPLRAPLPTIKVPLRETDADVPLHLQALIDKSYRNGGYEDTDYRQDPDPPLSAADQAWADELLRGQGLR